MKKKQEPSEIVAGPKITRAQYNEWRNHIYAIDIAKLKSAAKEKDVEIKTKEIEVCALKRQLMLRDYDDLQNSVAKEKKNYETYRDELGQLIGTNLDGAIIDPVSLEVKKIDQKESK